MIAIERRADRASAPQEDPGVPGDAVLLEQLRSTIRLWLLLECRQGIRGEALHDLAGGQPRDQVAVLDRRPGHPRTQRHEWVGDAEAARGQSIRRRAQDFAVRALAGRIDVGVGGHDEHDVVIRSLQRSGRQGDRCRGVASARFGEDPHAG